MDKNKLQNNISRAPVVAIMGHIDHGKSTLLDYIRKSNVVESEAGGITQHISAYEVIHKDEHGKDQKITFLDTPGHEAFSKMRERGALVADIAILIVSAEDGVKPQTVEAWKTIVESKIPVIVAINKIDKPGANIEKTKMELAENEIYLENYGGKIPCAEISAKAGTGIDNLLSLILIIAEMENFEGDTKENASGFVLESNLDSKRGIHATLIIKNGTLKKGMTVVVEDAICSTKMIENFLGKNINDATFSSPIRLIGFDKIPKVGAGFISFEKKKDAEEYAENKKNANFKHSDKDKIESTKKILPLVLKADASGSIEAIEKEIAKISSPSAEFRIIQSGVGAINENDVKTGQNTGAIILGFHVKADKNAIDYSQRQNIDIQFFDIIYKMTEYLAEQMETLRPKIETLELVGKTKILKAFSKTKEKQVLGGRVVEGKMLVNTNVKIMRRDFEIGTGRITNLEKGKNKTSEVEEGAEFGMMVESKLEIVPGDILESFTIIQK